MRSSSRFAGGASSEEEFGPRHAQGASAAARLNSAKRKSLSGYG